ncbi:MAG: hypothetical protein ACRD3L_08075 [Terriglobales bacterium]
MVQLDAPLSSLKAQLGDPFQAVLAEPIVVQGQTLAPSGTPITGRVLAAKASARRDPGYLRVTLSSIFLNGKPWSVHTSSIFSKGPREHPGSAASAASDTQFSTGRKLTFRLIEPLPLEG